MTFYYSEDSEVVIHSNDPVAPVGYLIFKNLSLELKLPPLDLPSRLKGLPLKDSNGYITDEGEEAFQITENDLGKWKVIPFLFLALLNDVICRLVI